MATADEKYDLITRGLQEILGGDIIKAILAEGRAPKAYWGALNMTPLTLSIDRSTLGTAPTGKRALCMSPTYAARLTTKSRSSYRLFRSFNEDRRFIESQCRGVTLFVYNCTNFIDRLRG